ncbi:MAG: DUF2062 domain-containing protein [Bacteroidota bacterium]
MQATSDIRASFKAERCCVLIPTYNNEATLRGVIESVRQFTDDIIVVNDGSTDTTAAILESLDGLQIVSYAPNRGKGIALRTGFEYAYSKGFRYAITIDSDGQHYAADLPQFIEKLPEERKSIIIGARNMDQASVPGKSSFGNKFSNFWFWLETGFKVPDTQSGYRLYPLEPLSKIKFFTSKFEFEIEVMVRAAWSGVNICSVPVKVFYPPANERVTHFRPFKDFTRITLLNTVFVILGALYFIPLRLIRNLKKKSFKQLIIDHILDGEESNGQKSAAIALGVFIGIIPIIGFQIVTCLAVSHMLKLNKILVVFAAHISIPPMIPLLIFLSFKTGGWLLGTSAIPFSHELTWHSVKHNLYQYVLGSVCFATMAAVLFGLLSYILLSVFRTGRLKEV